MIAAGGLAGKVTRVTGGTSEVTLITDASSAVSAQVMPNGANGIVKPELGKPEDLLLDFIQKGRRVTKGTTVVTSGFTVRRRSSPASRAASRSAGSRAWISTRWSSTSACTSSRSPTCARIDFVQVLASKGQPAQEQAGVIAP